MNKCHQSFVRILFLFSIYSCASHQIVIPYNDWIIQMDDRKQLKEVKDLLRWFKNHPQKSLEGIRVVHVSKNNCHFGEVACVNADRKETIYLNHHFFKLSFVEKLGTMIHEMAHHKYGYQHIRCESKIIKNIDCDDDLNSAFGDELRFYKSLLKEQDRPGKKLKDLIIKTEIRINSLQRIY